MRCGGEAFVVFLHGQNDPSHGGDRIDAEVRLGAVGGFALRADAPAHAALAGDDAAHLRGLGDDGGVGLHVLAELHDAAEGVFLIDDGGHPELARWLFAAGMHLRDGVHHGGEACLVIDGASTVHFAVLHDGIEGINRHAFDGNGVHVRLEDHAA